MQLYAIGLIYIMILEDPKKNKGQIKVAIYKQIPINKMFYTAVKTFVIVI